MNRKAFAYLFKRKAARIQRELQRLLPAARFDRIESLAQLRDSLWRVRFDDPPFDIDGWSTFDEQRALYALARFTDGPIMEIGPWLGRSTVCIARGIRDGGKTKAFLTCELAPSLKNFRAIGDEHVGFYYPPESEDSMGVCIREAFENEIKPVVGHPKTLVGLMKENLVKFGVADLVEVHVGDFRESPDAVYRLLFTDSMHDEKEIRRNAPDLRRFLRPGSILACHDTTEENEQLLRELFEFGYAFKVDTLFVGEILNVEE